MASSNATPSGRKTRSQQPFWPALGQLACRVDSKHGPAGVNVAAVTALVHYWPVLMIMAGLILLLTHPVAVPSSSRRTAAATETTETSHESRS